MPQDLAEFRKILLNSFPVYIDYQENNELKDENEYKVFYNINEKYDIVVVLSLICSNPIKIKIITVYLTFGSKHILTFKSSLIVIFCRFT